MTAPVTAIVGYDGRFYDLLPKLFPQTDARAWFVNTPDWPRSRRVATVCCRART